MQIKSCVTQLIKALPLLFFTQLGNIWGWVCVCVCARLPTCSYFVFVCILLFSLFRLSLFTSLSFTSLSLCVSLYISLFHLCLTLSFSLHLSLSHWCVFSTCCMMLDFVTVVSEALNQHVCLFVNLIPASKDTLKKNPGHVVICHTLLLCLLWLTPALPPTHTQSAVLRCLIMECRCM